MTTESLYQDHLINGTGERRHPEYCGDLLDALTKALERIEADFSRQWHVAVRAGRS